MIDIKLHTVIDTDDANKCARFWGYEGEDLAFSLETLNRILNEHPDDNEVNIGIHCDGGSVSEGLAIYDALRMSGKNIYTNIEGGCHSMAVCILLAAPKENRTANANCRALIHNVRADVFGYQTADELRIIAEEIEREEEAILNIYADRTGTDKETLRAIMKEEKQHTAQELIDLGFISKINVYTTNKKSHNMAQKASEKNLLQRIKNLLNSQDGIVNFDHTDADGNVLFSTEREDDTLAVGDAATPDGVYELPDGRKVTIENGVIASIEEPAAETETEEANAADEINALREQVANLEAQLAEATNLLREARNELQSNYTPAQRESNAVVNKGNANAKTADEVREEMFNKRKQMKG